MAEVRINPDDPTADPLGGDVEMAAGDDDVIEVGETGAAQDPAEGGEESAMVGDEETSKAIQRVTFVEYALPWIFLLSLARSKKKREQWLMRSGAVI